MEALPNEILFKIFEHFDYFELKLTLPAVCKRFRSFLASKSKTGMIDKILFRDEPASPNATTFLDESDYSVHPALTLLDFRFTGKINDVIFKGYNGYPDYSLPDTNLGVENAVTPAVSALELRFDQDYEALVDELENWKGVTVGDVMKTVVKFFTGSFWECRAWNGEITLESKGGKLVMYLDGFKYVPPPPIPRSGVIGVGRGKQGKAVESQQEVQEYRRHGPDR